MIIKSAELETVCGITSTLPETEILLDQWIVKPEVARKNIITAGQDTDDQLL